MGFPCSAPSPEEKKRKFAEGVGSWTSNYAGEKKRARAHRILNSIDLDDLAAACGRIRRKALEEDPSYKNKVVRVDCSISDHWAMGSRAIVVEARFGDGTRWAVKISMKPLQDPDHTYIPESGDAEAAYNSFQYEFDTMLFLKTHTQIPVPTPHLLMRLGTSLGPTVCLMMDLIPGTNGASLFNPSNGKYNPKIRRVVRSRQNQILKSLADVQITLDSFSMPVPGSLTRPAGFVETEVPFLGNFAVQTISDLEQTASCKPMEFYDYLIDKKASCGIANTNLSESEHQESARQIIDILETNLPAVHNQNSLFYLTNIDLGGHNTIFNKKGELLAMIDVDSFNFVPIECAALPPGGVGLDLYPNSATKVWREASESGVPYLEEYAQLLRQAGKDFGNPELGNKLSAYLLSDSAVLVAGIFKLDERDSSRNRDWLNSEAVRRLRRSESTISCAKPSTSAFEDGAAHLELKQPPAAG